MGTWIKKMHGQSAREEELRPTVDWRGKACFPGGISEIRDCAFDGNKELRTAVLPDTIKRIGVRAFADCPSLKKLVLNEGLEEIDSNAFTGCESLKSVVFPDSVKEVHGFAFYRSSFSDPVFSASGDVLYRYPEVTGKKSFTVPNQVKRIQAGAFLYLGELEEVILPDGLEYIHNRSFLHTGIRKLTLPASIKNVEAMSFWECENLEEVVLCCDSKALDTAAFNYCPKFKLITPGKTLDFEEAQRIRGLSVWSINRQLEIPKRDFWKEPVFASLARRCATGDTDAMMEFADYFETLGSDQFYSSAANFWRYRAFLYGNQQAIQWRKKWFLDKPETLIPVALNPHLSGGNGDKLRALGFEFFDPEREYHMDLKDENGIIEVSSWCGTEGPDEDGFGMEELYDWWFLDEFLNPIPNAKIIHDWSGSDRRNSERFAYFKEQAAAILREMKGDRNKR